MPTVRVDPSQATDPRVRQMIDDPEYFEKARQRASEAVVAEQKASGQAGWWAGLFARHATR